MCHGERFPESEIDILGANKTRAGRHRATEGLAVQETGEIGESQRDGAVADLIITCVATGISSAFHTAFATSEPTDYTYFISIERGEFSKVSEPCPPSGSYIQIRSASNRRGFPIEKSHASPISISRCIFPYSQTDITTECTY